MNKGELIQAIAQKSGLTQKNAGLALDSALEVIVDTVASGDKVTLVGFGVFESRSRKERQGRNPQTGKIVDIPAKTAPAFTPGKGFKEKVS